jgi:hypothetical protein
MRQDQAGLGVECVQQLRRLAVGEIVEAPPEHLAIERDCALCRAGHAGHAVQQAGSVAAKRLLDGLRIEPLENVANGGMGRRALPAQTEGGVQPAAVHRDEGFDGAIGIAAGDHGEDRKQQNVG